MKRIHFRRRTLPVALFLLALVASTTAVVRPAAVQASHARSNVTITMWTWKVFHKSAWQAVATAFKAKTGITVNIEAFSPDATYRQKVAAAAQTHALPDVVSYWSGDPTLSGPGNWIDLTGKVKPSAYLPGTFDKNSMITKQTYAGWAADPKDNKEALNLKVGHAYSVPALAGSANFMFFNKAMMKKAGLNPNKAPATFEELISDLQKITAAGEPGMAAGAKNPDLPFFWIIQPAYMQYVGPQAYDDQMNGYTSLNNPKFIHMLDLFKQLATDHLWVPGVSNIDIDPADVTFAQGHSSLDVGGTYSYAALEQLGVPASNILMFNVPGPAGSAVKHFVNAPFSLIDEGVTNTSKHQAEAIQWLNYSTTGAGAAIFAKYAKDLPAAKEPTSAAVVGTATANLETFFQANSKGEPGTGQYVIHGAMAGKNTNPGDPITVFENGVQQLVLGQGSTATLAAQTAAAITSYNKSNLVGGKPVRVVIPNH